MIGNRVYFLNVVSAETFGGNIWELGQLDKVLTDTDRVIIGLSSRLSFTPAQLGLPLARHTNPEPTTFFYAFFSFLLHEQAQAEDAA